MQWIKDLGAEALMKHHGIKWEVAEIPIKAIDLKESLDRQVRINNKLDQDRVLNIALAMQEEYTVMPMVIVQRWKNGKYFLWGGNHRTHGAESADMASVMAYVIDILDDRALTEIFPREVNLCIGTGTDKMERIANAIHYVETLHMTVEEAARKQGIPATLVYEHLKALRTTERLAQQGVDTKKLTQTSLVGLHHLRNNQNLERAAGDFLAREGLKGGEAAQFLKDVREAKTEAKGLAEIDRWKEMLARRRSPGRLKTKTQCRNANRSTFLSLLQRLEKFLAVNKTLVQAHVADPADTETVRKSWRAIERTMGTMLAKDKERSAVA